MTALGVGSLLLFCLASMHGDAGWALAGLLGCFLIGMIRVHLEPDEVPPVLPPSVAQPPAFSLPPGAGHLLWVAWIAFCYAALYVGLRAVTP
jgi:hypothetical protein